MLIFQPSSRGAKRREKNNKNCSLFRSPFGAARRFIFSQNAQQVARIIYFLAHSPRACFLSLKVFYEPKEAEFISLIFCTCVFRSRASYRQKAATLAAKISFAPILTDAHERHDNVTCAAYSSSFIYVRVN
jgi:hypothetical protein